MNAFEWVTPNTLSQALSSGAAPLAQIMNSSQPGGAPGAVVFKAGGTDLLDLLKEELIAPKRVVFLKGVPELSAGIRDEGRRGVRIGAFTTLTEIASNDLLRARYAAFASAAETSASPQLRNMATIAGNILQRPRCWYFRSVHHHCRKKGGRMCYAQNGENQYHAVFNNDVCAIVHPSTPATALVAFSAEVEVAGAAGSRRIPIDQFFTLPQADVHRENVLAANEVVTAVWLPASSAPLRSAHVRVNEKQEFDWPIADVAVVLERSGSQVRNARIVLGSAAPAPWRARAAEAQLQQAGASPESITQAALLATEGATPFERNEYKVSVLQTLVRRALSQTLSD